MVVLESFKTRRPLTLYRRYRQRLRRFGFDWGVSSNALRDYVWNVKLPCRKDTAHGRPRAKANDAAQIRTLAQQGLSQAAIARHLGLWRPPCGAC